MNVTLPDSLKEFVEKQATSGSYANPDAFVAELVRTEAERLDRISRGEAWDAPAPRSPCSSRITRSPRPAASRAMLTPFNPPPMIARS